MKKLILLAVILGSLTAFHTVQAQSVSDEVEMQAFARKFMAAYNEQDHAAIRQMYTDDAIRIDEEGKETRGADKIAAYFADQFRLNNATLLLRQMNIRWSDYEHAWVAEGIYEVHGRTNVYDIEIDRAGKYANAMLKQDGEWKIAKSMLSPLEHKDPKVAANIEMYTELWDRIVNDGKLDLFNDQYFTEDVLMHAEPENVVGIEAMAAYYKNFLTGFSDIQFTIKQIFGEGDHLFKHWRFEGTHTGDFFGIPATGKRISLEGSTIARMSADGRIAEERDFMDNMALLSQLGVVSSPGNAAVIDKLYTSFAKGDIPSAMATMDPNVVWNEAENFPYADRNPYIGPDAVLNGVFARIGQEWEYWKLTDIQLHEMSGNRILATLRYDAKHKKTGKVMDLQAAHLFTLKDGKIVAFQQYADTKQVTEVMKK